MIAEGQDVEHITTEQAFPRISSQSEDLWHWFQQAAWKQVLLLLLQLPAGGWKEKKKRKSS